MAFGASSEKLSAEIEQLELALEELEAAAVVTAIVSPVPKPDRPVSVRALPDHLPRDEVVVEPASGACTCPDCGGALRQLSADAAEQLDVAPIAWRVVRTIRPKYSCRTCDKIVQAPAPVKAIARGRATPSTARKGGRSGQASPHWRMSSCPSSIIICRSTIKRR
jgi:transposase